MVAVASVSIIVGSSRATHMSPCQHQNCCPVTTACVIQHGSLAEFIWTRDEVCPVSSGVCVFLMAV